MALTFSLPAGHSAKNAGLEVWMDRVLERADRVRGSFDPDSVHDLRVALRRCRTIADALSEVNPGPGLAQAEANQPQAFPRIG